MLNLYGKVADIPEVDYIHLDYIRYVDVILARGLWEKYGLVMDEEYPTADYCYCDKCVADFKVATGIDIKSVEDPSKCEEWAQFRCDLITKLVNRIAFPVHGVEGGVQSMLQHGGNPCVIFHAIGMGRFGGTLNFLRVVAGVVAHPVYSVSMPFTKVRL